jgi:hypothetical protein
VNQCDHIESEALIIILFEKNDFEKVVGFGGVNIWRKRESKAQEIRKWNKKFKPLTRWR